MYITLSTYVIQPETGVKVRAGAVNLKVYGPPDHFWIHPSKWSFWNEMIAHIFLITTVTFYV